jgi:hypothetical protein
MNQVGKSHGIPAEKLRIPRTSSPRPSKKNRVGVLLDQKDILMADPKPVDEIYTGLGGEGHPGFQQGLEVALI